MSDVNIDQLSPAIKPKAKRKLSSIDFAGETSHLALVHKDQGGPANGADYKLVLKSNQNFTDELIAKAAKIRVTMDIEDFLCQFYGMYYEDAEVLARALGFETAQDDAAETEPTTYEDYINSKVQAIEVLKALHEAEDISSIMSELDADQYLAILTDQALIEKALKKIEKAKTTQIRKESSKPKVKLVDPTLTLSKLDASTNASVEKTVGPSGSVIEKVTKETNMTVESTVVEQEVEVVSKSAYELIVKSMDEQKVQLTKALEAIATFEQEKKDSIIKSKTEKVLAIIKNEDHAKIITKASLELDSDDDFNSFLAAMQSMMTSVTTSDMFIEKGFIAEDQEKPVVKNDLERLLKAKYAK